jgi:DNA-binding NtrC family response regulator
MAADGVVLVIGLDAAEAEPLKLGAGAHGYSVRRTSGLSEGLSALREGSWAVTVLSLDVGGSDLALAARLVGEARVGGLVLVTASPTLALAVQATRMGAVDLLELPLDPAGVEDLLGRLRGAEGGRVALLEQMAGVGELVGSSGPLMEVFKVVGRVADSSASVLITGESGTGKELVARELHRSSGRRAGSFVAVNCAAIPEDLLESELFGHERGAFTGAVARKIGRFERAAGGTLFLDEIGDMSLVLQAKILRVLQEKEIERLGGEERIRVDVRVVAATHRDLARLIGEGEFREDLFYRLAVVRLELPALRDRGGDLRTLVLHYVARFAREYARPIRYVSHSALARLEEHAWPGNVRELRNVLERAVLVATGDTLRVEDVRLDRGRAAAVVGEALPGYSPSLTMAQVERLHLARVLEEVGGQLGKAAEVLGIHRNTVTRKLQEYGLDAEGGNRVP